MREMNVKLNFELLFSPPFRTELTFSVIKELAEGKENQNFL